MVLNLSTIINLNYQEIIIIKKDTNLRLNNAIIYDIFVLGIRLI